MGIPEGTILARAKREGWTQGIQSGKALVKRGVEKALQVRFQNEVTRKTRIPIDDAMEITGRAFQAVAATLKANCDKVLTQDLINEMFSSLRDAGQKLIRQSGNARPPIE